MCGEISRNKIGFNHLRIDLNSVSTTNLKGVTELSQNNSNMSADHAFRVVLTIKFIYVTIASLLTNRLENHRFSLVWIINA